MYSEVNLRELFELEHWSYLNNTERNYFKVHSFDRAIDQLALSIERGELTPFDNLYIIGESSKLRGGGSGKLRGENSKESLFIQTRNDPFRVLNPYYYKNLLGLLAPIFQSNRKGFIVTATVEEATRLTEFLNESVEGIEFEAYHPKMSREEREKVLSHSGSEKPHYIVAVRSLDEGLDLPHLSAHIDLNTNMLVKQMVRRIGRVLHLYTGKERADILFLSDYHNEKRAQDLLELLQATKRLNFQAGSDKKEENGGELGDVLKFSEGLKIWTREELEELKLELEGTVRSFGSKKKNRTYLQLWKPKTNPLLKSL